MTWPDEKAKFQDEFEKLMQYAQNGMPADIQSLTTAMAGYVEAGGISNDPSQDGNYNTIISTSQRLRKNKAALLSLNQNVVDTISNLTSNNDMTSLLTENGNLQQTIQNLDKVKKDLEEDAQSAQLRDELLRTRNTNVTKHQLFLLGRPLRPASVPYLWALSVLFIGIGLLLFSVTFPMPYTSADSFLFDFTQTMSMPIVWGSIAGATVIVIIFLSLAVAGVFKP